MINAYDIAYGLGVMAAAPVWAARTKSRDKVLTAFRERLGQMPRRVGGRPAVWIHAVSLGEVNAARSLVDQLLSARDDLDVIVSTTTTTGHERAARLYLHSPRVSVVRYPLDFSAAITRALDALRPSVVVLMELETWPNFLRHCERRGVPVVLANGRITVHSFSRYRWIKPIVAKMFRRLAAVCVQDAEYARRFEALGASPTKMTITGTMKYDSAEVADCVAGAAELQRALRLEQNQPLWVCGSTGPGEEAIALHVYRRLLPRFPQLRLAIIPRHPQRFDEVGALISSGGFALLRRSETLLPLPALGERAEERVFEHGMKSNGKESFPQHTLLDTVEQEADGRAVAAADEKKAGPLPNPLPDYREREAAAVPARQATELTPPSVPSMTNSSSVSEATRGNIPVTRLPAADSLERSISRLETGTSPAVLLGDTMGELRKFYSLATVVFVGRSLVDLGSRQHGSDMIEPAALAKPCIVGPFTGNFDQAVRALKAAEAIVEVFDAEALETTLAGILSDPPSATALGQRAQTVVRQQQGATALHLAIILRFVASSGEHSTNDE